jgi:hypothetical protein
MNYAPTLSQSAKLREICCARNDHCRSDRVWVLVEPPSRANGEGGKLRQKATKLLA